MSYYMINVTLNDEQARILTNAFEHFQPTAITFQNRQLDSEDGDAILVTKAQLNRINKAISSGKNI